MIKAIAVAAALLMAIPAQAECFLGFCWPTHVHHHHRHHRYARHPHHKRYWGSTKVIVARHTRHVEQPLDASPIQPVK